jgi:hypothetical protein
MMRLRIQEIRAPLSDGSQDPSVALFDASMHHNFWLDSKIELEDGLDVVELPGDAVVAQVQHEASDAPIEAGDLRPDAWAAAAEWCETPR